MEIIDKDNDNQYTINVLDYISNHLRISDETNQEDIHDDEDWHTEISLDKEESEKRETNVMKITPL